MGLLDGVLGAVGGLLGFAGQQSANDAQQAMLERQIEWQREVLQNKIQWQTQDLRNAGLNPILAAMSPASGSAPSASAPQVGNVGQAAVSSAAALANVAQQFGHLENESRKVDAEVTESSARASKAVEDAKLTRDIRNANLPQADFRLKDSSARAHEANIEYIQHNIKRVDQDIRESESRIQQMTAQIAVYDAQIAQLRAETHTEATKQQLNQAVTLRNQAEARIAREREKVVALEAQGQELSNELKKYDVEFYRQNPEMSTYEGRRRYYKNSGVNIHGPGGFGFGFQY